MKDAYYFPHFCNARNDRKIKRIRKELGIEGYGIYFMLLETLRDQDGFKFPLEDIDLLADEFGTSEQKLRTVVCNYKLFNVDENENFFSLKFIEYLKPYLDTKQRKKIGGIKGNLIKYGYATKKELEGLSDMQILELNENKHLLQISHTDSDTDHSSSQSKVKESKVKESKVKETEIRDNVYSFRQQIDMKLRQYKLNMNIDNIVKLSKGDIQGTLDRIDAFHTKGVPYLLASIRDKYNTTAHTEAKKQCDLEDKAFNDNLKKMGLM